MADIIQLIFLMDGEVMIDGIYTVWNRERNLR
jgi:hypothetical protein